jgi:hypothetical protein
MKTRMGVCRPCCENCTVGTDNYNDGVINSKWTTITGTPVESSGVITIQSDDNEYMVWEDDPLLEPGVTGISVELDIQFNKAPDHPTIPTGYGQGHGFDIVWDWQGEGEFMTAKLVFTGGIADPKLRIVVNNQIDGSGEIATLELDLPVSEFVDNPVHVKICIYRDDEYSYGYGYDSGWKIYLNANSKQRIFPIPEPENLRAGFGANLTIVSPGTFDNPYSVDNWKLNKINENCKCYVNTPTVCCFGHALPAKIYLSLTVLDPGDPECPCDLSGAQDIELPRLDGSRDPYPIDHTGFSYQIGTVFGPALFCQMRMWHFQCPTVSGGTHGFFIDMWTLSGINWRFLIHPDKVSCDPFYVSARTDDLPGWLSGPAASHGQHIPPAICHFNYPFGGPYTRLPVFLIEMYE